MTHAAPSSAHHLLQHAYAAFNARDIASALLAMHPDVEWPNGMEGGVVHGRDEVRDYWTRQWGVTDPHVDPVRIDTDDDGQLIVAVHQIIRDLTGHVVSERFVEHAYLVEDGLIKRMEIRQAEPGTASRTSQYS
jgi:nuclear transport factor 2 (NTF2) superfamily protein